MLDEILWRQSGVITRTQARAAGLTEGVLRARLHNGRWIKVGRGVYRTFTGPPPRMAQVWAAVLRAGPGAALSHETAAELVGLVDKPSKLIHVTVPAARRVRRVDDAVVVHHSARAAEATHPGLEPPRTRIEETVIDLTQASGHVNQAIGWITTACGRRLTTPRRLLEALVKRKRVRWRPLLLAVLDDTTAGCHSVLERYYFHDVERAHPTSARPASSGRRGRR